MGPLWGCNFNDSSDNNQRFGLASKDGQIVKLQKIYLGAFDSQRVSPASGTPMLSVNPTHSLIG